MIGGGDLQQQPATQEGRLWKAACKAEEQRAGALIAALHDAIRRPLGVVPDSAVPFYDQGEADRAKERRPRHGSEAFRREDRRADTLPRPAPPTGTGGGDGLAEAVRPEVYAFAMLMERELRANDHKGGWKGDDIVLLTDRVWQETTELRDVVREYEVAALSPVPEPWKSRVASEAADVANMAMMVADVCGCLNEIAPMPLRLTLNEWGAKSHHDQVRWWMNPSTGKPIERNDGELLMLMVSEISEAMEGIRKNLMDDKLPHRRMVEVEMADLFIRMMDFAGARGLDLDGAVAEKTAFNATRKDHTFEARLAANGKKF